MLFSIESANIIKPLIFLVQKSCIFKIKSYLCNAFNKSTSERKFGRGGRVVDCGGLENRCTARYPGFESLSLRNKWCKSSDCEIYTLYCTHKLGNMDKCGREKKKESLSLFVSIFFSDAAKTSLGYLGYITTGIN